MSIPNPGVLRKGPRMRTGSLLRVCIKLGVIRQERIEAANVSRMNALLPSQQIFFAGYLFADCC